MERLIVFASEDCLGWEELRAVLDQLQARRDVDIRIKDPIEHEEEFYRHGLVICPSILYGDELIAVGAPDLDTLIERLNEKEENSNPNQTGSPQNRSPLEEKRL